MSDELDLDLPAAGMPNAKMFFFFVPGIPAPGGSKRFVGIGRKTGRAILIDAGGERTKNWRTSVATIGSQIFSSIGPLQGPLSVTFAFHMPRPKGHFHPTGIRAGKLRNTAPKYPTTKPDTTKLIRSTEDALKGITWLDDSQIVHQIGFKGYADDGAPGCRIVIQAL